MVYREKQDEKLETGRCYLGKTKGGRSVWWKQSAAVYLSSGLGMTEIGQPDSTRPTPDSRGFVSSRDFENVPGVPEPEVCEFCGATLYHKGIVIGERVLWTPVVTHCTCPEAVSAYETAEAKRKAREAAECKAEENRKLRERVKKIVGESGMGERFSRRTFDTFQETPENRRALAACRKYADGFDSLLLKHGQPEPGRNGLFISGPPGTGKTHLAAAISNQLLSQGKPVVCMTMIDLLERIKRTFNKTGADEGEVLQIYKTIPLLVIDDIGKEPPTEWAISTVYNIINARYEAYLPTVVTTNYAPDDMIGRMTPRATGDSTTARATVDRLMEMCNGISLTGKSWRGR